MSSNGIFSLLQFACRKNHSTETALLEEKNDLLIMNMNKGHVSLLVLLDLSAVFDTVDHEILMRRLQTEFGVGGAVLSWFVSYVNHRSQRVSVNGVKSDVLDLSSGGLQGPCFGPLVFLVYASNIFSVIRSRLPPVRRSLMTLSYIFHFLPTLSTIRPLPLLQWDTASATLGFG